VGQVTVLQSQADKPHLLGDGGDGVEADVAEEYEGGAVPDAARAEWRPPAVGEVALLSLGTTLKTAQQSSLWQQHSLCSRLLAPRSQRRVENVLCIFATARQSINKQH